MKISSLGRFVAVLTVAVASIGCGVDPDTRVPALQYGEGLGCGNIFVHAENAAKTEVLVIQGNRDTLELATTPRTFLIEQNPAGLDLHIDLFDSPHDGNRYCSDIGGASVPVSQWRATRGRVEISISDVAVPFNNPYRTTIRLSDVVFTNPQSTRSVTLPALTLENITVGWLPG